MNFKYLVLIIISTGLLVLNQIELKLWLINKKICLWPLNINIIKSLFSAEILICFISLGIGWIIWIYLLNEIEFSILYPMVSISYIFGLIASIIVFHESVPLIRWIGVGVIILGLILVAQK